MEDNNNNGAAVAGNEQDVADNALKEDSVGVIEGKQNTTTKNDVSPSSKSNSKCAQSSFTSNSPSRSDHQESVNTAAMDTGNKSAGASGHTEHLTEKVAAPAVATDGSTSDPVSNPDEVETNAQERENKPSEDTKEDMEVEDTNDGSPPNNQDAQSSENDKKVKNGSLMERRTSKRQRTSTSHRFEPGEGGGLASKKPKANNGSSGLGSGSPKKVATPKTQSNLAPSTSSSSLKSQGAGSNGGKIETDDKSHHREGGNDDSITEKPGPQEWSEPIYHWIDEGNKSDVDPTSVEHQGLEIDFTNSKTANWTPPPPFKIRPGDVVLLSSGDTPWNEVKQQQQSAQASQEDQANNNTQHHHEVVPIYNDPASNEAGLGALDPYIGYVERLWEEAEEDPSSKKGSLGGQNKRKKGGGNKSAKSNVSSRMMIRTRWFFKKENVEGLKGSFVIEGGDGGGSNNNNNGGNAKHKIMASMDSQDLVLTDISDDNAITTILGKIQVVKRKPLDHQSSEHDDIEMAVPKGVHVCRYDISFGTSQSSGKEGIVKFFPYSDDDREHGVSFKAGTENDSNGKGGEESKDIDDSDPTSTDEDGDTSLKLPGGNNNNYSPPCSALPFPMSPRRLVSEGATTVGKIKIGANHQATIPPQLDLQRKTSFRGLAHPPSQRIPTMVWDPDTDDGDAVEGYLEEAGSLLSNHLKLIQLEPFHIMNDVEAPNTKAETKKPREINIDSLLTELHECKGDAEKAIKKISSNPEKYMAIWTSTEKDQFDQGYRTYRESIRMISNSLGPTKSCKDAVDYQYRFKLVENFRRFKMKKREKAEEIMATVEDRMLNEKVKADARSQDAIETDSSSEEEEEGKAPSLINSQVGSTLTGKPVTRVGPVNNRVRTWFRTGGGGEDAVGATQKRRNDACDFLSQVTERVGKDAYVTLAKSLKACNSSQGVEDSLTDVKSVATDIMKAHPDLLKRFMTFLPKEVRSN